MHGYIQRQTGARIEKMLSRAPVTVILGPRQCGKSTLAKRLITGKDAVYLDLQNRADLNKLHEPELFFDLHRHHLVCLDEIQRVPDFFTALRSEIDRDRRPGRFLLLGSASRDLIRQSSETLAGRIAYLDLTPFIFSEVIHHRALMAFWLRGGFPESILAPDDETSMEWRLDFVRSYLERDIPALGVSLAVPAMERFWLLLAHYHGQTVNYSKLAAAADLSIPSVKRYLSILEQTYMIRLLQPYSANLKKRLVKSPKLYIRDSGILHALLDIETCDDVLANPVVGVSWEGMALENILAVHRRYRPFFIRTSNGAEIDLVLEKGREKFFFEFKAGKAPKLSRGFYELSGQFAPDRCFIISPTDESYVYDHNVWVMTLKDALRGDLFTRYSKRVRGDFSTTKDTKNHEKGSENERELTTDKHR